MSRGKVEIAAYSNEWSNIFENEAKLIHSVFLPDRVEIEHIGSTAVPGMSAKPIIDILLGAPAVTLIEGRIAALRELGYEYVPEFENQLPHRRYFVKPSEGEARFHIHAVARASPFWRDHLAFRDLLRTNRRVFNEYLSLKQGLAESSIDRGAYTDAKGPFIAAAVQEYAGPA